MPNKNKAHNTLQKSSPLTSDPEQAAAKARAERRAKCEARIKAILIEDGCSLNVIQVWHNGQPGPLSIEVTANQVTPPVPEAPLTNP